jgi:hypothetical protein
VVRRLTWLVVAVAAWSLSGTARAAGVDDDARVAVRCTGASTGRLRVQAEDGRLRIELELRSARRGARWSVVVLHERRLVARTTVRAPLGGGTLRIRRSAPDWFGSDAVVVRATRSGESCRATAVI